MHRFRHLMVGLTRSEADAGLIAYAAMVVRLGTVDAVRFVHVTASGVEERDRIIDELKAMVQPGFDGLPDVAISYEVLAGPVVDRLLEHIAERSVDLLLVGDRRGHGSRKTLARRLVMKAPCSVWLVPEGSRAELTRILVPVDFSQSAADSMRVATSMAGLSGHAECLALHVYFNEAAVTYPEYDQVIRGQEDEAFQRFLAPIDCHGVKVIPRFEEGAIVANVIERVALAQGVDLVIMGTRGRSRSAAILLGSVTEQMIVETRVPLLAVKHFGARLSVLQALLDRRFWHQGDLHT